MGNFNRDNKGSGGGFNRGFGGGKKFDRRDGDRPAMYKATCSECGASCELPFKPTGERPVFCSDCFGKQNGGGGRPNKFGGERRERPRFEDRQMHDAVCAICGKECQVPFRPTAGKPIYCNDCFDRGGSPRFGEAGSSRGEAGSNDSGGVMEQIRLLNVKIDKIMKVLIPNAPIEKINKPEFKEVMRGKFSSQGRDAKIYSQLKGLDKAGKKTKTKVATKKSSTKKKK